MYDKICNLASRLQSFGMEVEWFADRNALRVDTPESSDFAGFMASLSPEDHMWVIDRIDRLHRNPFCKWLKF